MAVMRRPEVISRSFRGAWVRGVYHYRVPFYGKISPSTGFNIRNCALNNCLKGVDLVAGASGMVYAAKMRQLLTLEQQPPNISPKACRTSDI